MYNKVFKNNQVNLLEAYKIKSIFDKYTNQDKPAESVKEEQNPPEEEKKVNEATTQHEDIIESAREEALLIIEEANMEAEKILDAAKLKAKEELALAISKGYKEGLQKGNAEAVEEYEGIMAEINHLKAKAIEDYVSLMNKAETEIVALSIDIAKKVIAQELTLNPKVIAEIAKECIRRTEEKNIILEITGLAPEEKEQLKLELNREYGKVEVNIVDNPALRVGDCIVKTELGSIDGTIQSKLQKIEQGFQEISSANQEVCDESVQEEGQLIAFMPDDEGQEEEVEE